jgi:hypothetical protein
MDLEVVFYKNRYAVGCVITTPREPPFPPLPIVFGPNFAEGGVA